MEGLLSNGARRRLIVAAALVVAVGCTAQGSNVPTSPSPASIASSAAPEPTTPASSAPPVATKGSAIEIRSPRDGSLLVNGTYPHVPSKCRRPKQPSLQARYPGTLEATRADDGTVTLTVRMPFERYLEGISEVSPSWPAASLDAQAIASRTYALAATGWHGAPGETLHSPICATTSCQVYRGLPVTPDPTLRRWTDAVTRTAGQVLLYRGLPAQTFYFSTSNGRTYGNDDIFQGAPLPYLRSVPERDDGVSPESHWTATVTLQDLTRFLTAAGEWPSGAAISDVARKGESVVVSGHGESRSIGVATFRGALNQWAPCLAPNRFPPPSWKGTPLPVTVPSLWFSVARRPGAVVLAGRGWGHGVGMVQWGAYGKALRGFSAGRILAYYYGGLRPRPFPEPGTIRVLVADGLTSVSVEPSGPGATVDGQPAAAGSLVITGGDVLTVTVRPA